jgi:probable F420-dependent oxidoreductase
VIVGSHLPQFGRAAGPAAIRRAAVHAEELGFAHVWVSDHVAIPASQDYPSPYLYDPLLSLAWAAAATTTIGLGTSVLVAPQHHPVALANSLASLDALSDGRLTVGIGVGWSEAEFHALGQDFHTRGRRTDEILDILRACWRDDPVTFRGDFYELDELRVLPKPEHDIEIWVGGSSEAGYLRATTAGDG